MWGGEYVVLDDNLETLNREEDLLGISLYENFCSFEMNNRDLASKNYYDKVKFIEENSKFWNKIDVLAEAEKYFDFENAKTVKYSGYLVNHTKKQAIDLADYFARSVSLTSKGLEEYAIDAIPPLTETGGGLGMALFDGLSVDSTEQLNGVWRSDLLQIVDELPSEYTVITCCFAAILRKAFYCENKFGLDKENLILADNNGKKFEVVSLSVRMTRGRSSYIKIEANDDGVRYMPVVCD
jgi:hypothetical protein